MCDIQIFFAALIGSSLFVRFQIVHLVHVMINVSNNFEDHNNRISPKIQLIERIIKLAKYDHIMNRSTLY